MTVSVLICTYNSKNKLRETLACLKRQETKSDVIWEVLIVDFMSRDGTTEEAKLFWGDCAVPLRCIEERRPGKTAALETGFLNAYGEAVCIVDDDNWVAEDYVIVAANVMGTHPDVGAIGAFGEPAFEQLHPEWFDRISGMYAVGHQASHSGYTDDSCLSFWGASSVIRRSAWKKLRAAGFKPVFNPSRADGLNFAPGSTGGEDPELCFGIQLAGYRLWYEPSLRYKHFIPASRLTREYVASTALATSMASPILKVYRSRVLSMLKKGDWKAIVYNSWLLHMTVAIVMFTVKRLKYGVGVQTMERMRTEREYLGQVIGLWRWRREYRKIVEQIDGLVLRQ